MEKGQLCYYCEEKIKCENILQCNQCLKSFHIKCLKRPGTPGDLCGDVFFDFTCIRCSPLEEIFVRKKIPWLIVIVLAIYNLTIQSQGLSHNGYFHWRSHISAWVDKNWKYLFGANIKQRKKWYGTLSGILSAYSPEFFESGANKNLTDSGWWKLSSKQTPKYFMNLYENIPKRQNKLRSKAEISKSEIAKKIKTEESDNHEESESSDVESDDNYICSRFVPYMGRKRKRHQSEQSRNSESSVKLSLMNFLAENISSQTPLLDNSAISPNIYEDFTFNSNTDISSLLYENNLDLNIDNVPKQNQDFQPRIIQITNYQNFESDLKNESVKVNAINDSDESSLSESQHSDEDDESTIVEFEKSLFTKRPTRPLPWLKRRSTVLHDSKDAQSLSEYDEKKLYMALRRVFTIEKGSKSLEIPTDIRLLYRKLSLKILKKQTGLKQFDLDNYMKNNWEKEKSVNILDRYFCFITDSLIHTVENSKRTFLAQLSGSNDYELFESPHTSRVLMPFIYRNSTYFPNWIKLMCEIQFSRIGNLSKKVERSTIDFCYVRPYHIAGVNSLLQQMFWPGIDMSECLAYPDFSVVALYKKLIVGCAFMVPDVSYNEAYISYMAVRPHWQRSGIASFMLYHLTQTCMGKDITLHVSASNPAICLYQKFGFKIEELVLDFYEKYLPIESSQSRHAFFLRLRR
ncbi:cysteine-rich protein 2-binding protein [Condylostylus longicornis]|uniref:cysteine-rich protein 2-binding protein n=1 Tax=Condylostylus longicornis TaxID=2530218 RepID=UPI00244DB3EA|nr:cysteine-rich protein 2-binding protein [Condylostylus longicornis]